MDTTISRRLRGKIPGEDTGIEIRKSVCTICDPITQCGLDLYVKDGRIVKVEGSKENPHSGGTLCSKGAALRQYVYHKDRLKTPLKRIGARGSGEFEAISWDEALDTVTAQLRATAAAHGPESVVFYAGYTKWMRPFLHRLAGAFGSPNYLTESSTCFRATAMAQNLTFGAPAGPDLKNTRCLLVWSANPFHTNTSQARVLLDAREKGLKIICVDPRLSPMATHADLHLQLRPGSDGALALSMANVIVAEDLYDRAFVAEHTHGFDEFAAYVAAFTPERGAELTGVPASQIRAAARLYATTKPAAIMPSASPVVHHTNGVQNYRAVFALAGLTGNYDVLGGNLVDPPSWLYVPGGFTSREHEFCHPRPAAEMAPPIGADRFPVWNELVDEGQSMHLPEQLRSGKPYSLHALLAFGLNYRMWPDSEGMRAALDRLDFVVDVDLFQTDTCRYADIVLPAASSVERSELRCYAQRWIIYTEPAIHPLYESRSDADIIYDLAARLELEDELFQAGYEASLDWCLAPSGITIGELEQHPGGMPVPNPNRPAGRTYEKAGFKTPSGKLEFASTRLARYADSHGYDTLPVYHPPGQSRETTPDLAVEYPLVLNTGSRLPMFIHSRTFRLRWTNSLRPEAAADLNPADAGNLGIAQGDAIRLSTPQGAITVQANLTEIAQPGVVHMYHAYPEADVNRLIPHDYLDPISGFPGFKGLLCRVEKVEG